LRQAGNILRIELEKSKNLGREKLREIEEKLMYKALKDMNLSKLVKDDIKLFESLLDDVFVNINRENKPNEAVMKMVGEIAKEKKFILDAFDKDVW
jgi:dynein heavy chain